MQNEDAYILSEFKKSLQRNDRESVIDLDDGFNHKFEFTLQRYEDILRDTNRSIAPNRWSYHRIGLTTKGGGEFITGVYNFKAKKNTLIVIPSRVITSSKNWTIETEGYFAVFNMDFFLKNNFSNKFFEGKNILSGSYQPYVHLTDEQAQGISDILESVLKVQASNNLAKNELVTIKLAELLVISEQYFNEQLHFGKCAPTLNIMRKFSSLVENNFIKERGVQFYAEQLNIHPNHLNSLIKRETGLTAKASIQSRSSRDKIFIEINKSLHKRDFRQVGL